MGYLCEHEEGFIDSKRHRRSALGFSDLRLPYISVRNPHARLAERAIKDVAWSLGLVHDGNENYFDAFNQASSFTYPGASVERLMACVQWCDWLFLFDDQYDLDRNFARREARLDRIAEDYLALLGGAPLGERTDALALFTRDLSLRLSALASPAWRSRFVRSVEDYLSKGVLRTARNFAAGQVPDLATYMRDRQFDSAVLTTLDMIEVAAEIDLPAAIVEYPTIQRMRHVCARIVAFVNDIVSYQKEVLKHENPNNLLHVLMVNEGCTLERALSRTVEIVNECVEEFDELRLDLPVWTPRVRDAVDQYVEGMEHWMRGNLDWSLQTSRYCSRQSPFKELRGYQSVPPPPS